MAQGYVARMYGLGKGVPTESAYVRPDGTEFAHGGGPPNAAGSWVVVLPSHEPRWPTEVDRYLMPGVNVPAVMVDDPDWLVDILLKVS